MGSALTARGQYLLLRGLIDSDIIPPTRNRSGMDIVRVLRVIEYTGPRESVEAQLRNSKPDGEHFGQRVINPRGNLNRFSDVEPCTYRIATLGQYPEILNVKPETPAKETPNVDKARADAIFQQQTSHRSSDET